MTTPPQFRGEHLYEGTLDGIQSHQVQFDGEHPVHQTSDHASAQAHPYDQQFYETDLIPVISGTQFQVTDEHDFMPGHSRIFDDDFYLPFVPLPEMQGEVPLLAMAGGHHGSLAAHTGEDATQVVSISVNADDDMDPLGVELRVFDDYPDSSDAGETHSPFYSPNLPFYHPSTPSYNGSYNSSPYSNYSDLSPDPNQRMLPDVLDSVPAFQNDQVGFTPGTPSSLLLVPDSGHAPGPSSIDHRQSHRKLGSLGSIGDTSNGFLSPEFGLRRIKSESGFRQYASHPRDRRLSGAHGHSHSARQSPYPSPKLLASKPLVEDSQLLFVPLDIMGQSGPGLSKPKTGTLYTETPGYPKSNISGGVETAVTSESEMAKKYQVTTDRTAIASRIRRKQEAVFRCTFLGCESTFTRRYNLKSHVRSHNNERPFVCSWSACAKAFTRQHDCKRHEERHSHTTYPCEVCGVVFGRMDARRKHLRSEHGVESRKKSTGLAQNEQLMEDIMQSLVIA